MPKTFNPISILGSVIGALLGRLVLSQFSNYINDDFAVFALTVGFAGLVGLIGYMVGILVVLEIKQKQVVTEYKVKSLRYVPETRQIRERISDDQIAISFDDLPQFRIEYDLSFGDKTGPTEVRNAQVLEEKTDGIVLKVITWEYKFPLQQFLQYLRGPSYVFIVPKETVLTE